MTHNALHSRIFAVCLCLQHIAFALYEHHESIRRFALQYDGGAVGVLKILECFDARVELFFREGAESGELAQEGGGFEFFSSFQSSSCALLRLYLLQDAFALQPTSMIFVLKLKCLEMSVCFPFRRGC